MEHDHAPAAIRRRLAAPPRPSYLRDWVYGGIDGAVTTFAIVSGVVGASLSPRVILVLGIANIVADGISMAASNLLGTRAEREEWRHLAAVERRHVQVAPEGEREEVREIFRRMGLDGEPLEQAVRAVTADRERWIRFMLMEEYGLPREVRSPWRAALSTFAAFLACGLVPLAPFLFGWTEPVGLATAATGLVFFAIGSLKSRWSSRPWWWSGLETLAVGSVAAGSAYAIGYALRGLA